MSKAGENGAGGSAGLPDPENPSQAQLQAYGDFCFLYLRSDFHRDVPLHLARLSLQPPIDLGFYKIFRFDDVPRFGITWAFLGPDAERKFVTGEFLKPAEWRSGDRMWVVEIIAPYGKRTAVAAVNWLRKSLPAEIDTVRYLRATGDRKINKIIECRRGAGKIWGAQVITPQTLAQQQG